MTITWTTFVIRLLVGFLLAVGIGIERQWLKTREVLKINVLVTLGSAMFVMLSIMTPGDTSPTRISAQIVSGVGFLGGGVILREGASVRGINTAATLWCAAAIGTLVGSGYLVQAYSATLVVVGANLLLRPLVETFKYQRDKGNREAKINSSQNKVGQTNLNLFSTDDKHNRMAALRASNLSAPSSSSEASSRQGYKCSCCITCLPEGESKVFELLFKFGKERKLVPLSVQSKNINSEIKPGKLEVKIDIDFMYQDDRFNLLDSEEIVRLLKTEAHVNSVNWQFSPNVDISSN